MPDEPTTHLVPRYDFTYGPEFLDVGRACGIEPLPYQISAVNDVCGVVEENDLWAAPDVALFIPRQNGKGTTLEIRVMGGIAVLGETRILWTAHQVPTALEAKKRLEIAATNCDALRSRIKRIIDTNGKECIEFYNLDRSKRITEPATIRFVARTKDAGRGFTKAQILVFDESYKLTSSQAAATEPVLSTVRNPQVWYTSSPPLDASPFGPRLEPDEAPGVPMFDLRRRAAENDAGLYYAEWGIPPNLDQLEDRDSATAKLLFDVRDRWWWYRTNPGLGPLVQMSNVEREARKGRRAFARERLGAWPPAPRSAEEEEPPVISPQVWEDSATDRLTPGEWVALGIDSSPSRSGVAITAFWIQPDGTEAAEVVDYRSGLGWLPGRLRELADAHNPMCVSFDGRSQVGVAKSDLTGVGFQIIDPRAEDPPVWGGLLALESADVAAASSGAIEAIASGNVRHRNQKELTIAASGVKLRSVGDNLRMFGRKVSSTDICAINSWAFARQGWRMVGNTIRKFDPFGSFW